MNIDLRNDFDEKGDFRGTGRSGYENGSIYRKGKVLQVWYECGDKETWTRAPSIEDARLNFELLLEGFNEKEEETKMSEESKALEDLDLILFAASEPFRNADPGSTPKYRDMLTALNVITEIANDLKGKISNGSGE